MATTEKVWIKKAELAGSTISTASYGRFKFDSNGVAKVPVALARELIATGTGFTVIDDYGNPIDLPSDTDPIKYTLSGGGEYYSIESGYVLLGENSQYTLVSSNIDANTIYVKDNKLGFTEDVDTSVIHVLGVEENSTVKIGDKEYKWINSDDNPYNGLELLEIESTIPSGDDTVKPDPTIPSGDDTVKPEPIPLTGGGEYYSIEGGYVLNDGDYQVTLIGDTLDTDHIYIKDNKLGFTEGTNPNSIHVIGVNKDETVEIGNSIYKYDNTDNMNSNGMELVLVSTNDTVEPEPTVPSGDDTVKPEPTVPSGDDTVKPEPTIPSGDDTVKPEPTIPSGDDTVKPEPIPLTGGGEYYSIEGGYVLNDGDYQVTLIGNVLDTDHVYIKDNKLGFTEGIKPNTIHVIGVNKDDTVEIGNSVYKYDNTDNISSNGMELVLVSTKDTVEPEPTIPSGDDTLDSFIYDFDGDSFTVKGGLNENVSVYDLNEKATYDKSQLTIGEGIIKDLNDVHIQGLESNTKVNVDGADFVLQDMDNNLENGLELIGETSDIEGWKFVNRLGDKAEPQVWEHYTEGVNDIIVVGCIGRPSLNENTLTLKGETFKSITNVSKDELIISSDIINGKLTKGISWKDTIGIKTGLGTDSHMYYKEILYLPKAYISGVTSELTYTLNKGTLTITNGTIEPSKVIAKGSSISSVVYKGKTYFVNLKTGKLVQNAWQKRTK